MQQSLFVISSIDSPSVRDITIIILYGDGLYGYHAVLSLGFLDGSVSICLCPSSLTETVLTLSLHLIVGEAVPFFSVLLGLMSALFDGFFGFIYWALAYREINKGQLWKGQGALRKAESIFNVFIFLSGVFIFGPGVYTSVIAIMQSYASGSVKGPFTCANNAI